MVRRTIGYGASMLIAIALLAGAAAANPLALVSGDGGGQAAGSADGSYYVDASDGLDKARDEAANAHERATQTARDTNNAYTDAKHEAWSTARDTELPQRPACECDRIADELEHAGSMQASHADAVEKAADVDTELVDAGADLSGTAQVSAWFSDAFEGARDAFDDVRGALGYETQADEKAKAIADDAIAADDELRSELVSQLDEEPELPQPDPSASGSFAAEHATEVTGSAVGDITGSID